MVNEATKDGNKEIAELKKQTAHEEVLKAQQEALQARQRALQEQESIKPLVEQKNALRGEIEALQTEKEVLTAAEVEAIKGEKTLLGGLKGVTHKEFEAVKRTAAAVESMTAERDQALARAERADLQPPPPKPRESAYADAKPTASSENPRGGAGQTEHESPNGDSSASQGKSDLEDGEQQSPW